jgi:hypothetical protein
LVTPQCARCNTRSPWSGPTGCATGTRYLHGIVLKIKGNFFVIEGDEHRLFDRIDRHQLQHTIGNIHFIIQDQCSGVLDWFAFGLIGHEGPLFATNASKTRQEELRPILRWFFFGLRRRRYHRRLDAEGVALAPSGTDGGYVIVSSQGDNAYAVYRLPDVRYVGRVRITEGAIDGVQETDGIELMLGAFGPDFPGGLFVVQDGNNLPQTQNFKLVNWADVVAALGL